MSAVLTKKRRAPNKLHSWGKNLHKDIDTMVHLRADLLRIMERMQDMDDGLKLAEVELRSGHPSGETMEAVSTIASQIASKTNIMNRTIKRRRRVSGGSFLNLDYPPAQLAAVCCCAGSWDKDGKQIKCGECGCCRGRNQNGLTAQG